MNSYNGWGDSYFVWLEKLVTTIVERVEKALLSLPLVKKVALLLSCENNKTMVYEILWV